MNTLISFPEFSSPSQSQDYYEAFVERIQELKSKGHLVDLNRFSWQESQEMLKDFKGNFSDFLDEERNA